MPTPAELRAQAAQLLIKAAEQERPLSSADVHTMFQNRLYDEIEQARKDGRIDYTIATNPEGGN
jgi:hypothetical protein